MTLDGCMLFALLACLRSLADAAFKPSHLRSDFLQQAAYRATIAYTMAGPSGTVRVWTEDCDEGLCEHYSVGDGFCVIQATNLSNSGAIATSILSSNCRVTGLGSELNLQRDALQEFSTKVQLYHCPKQVPIALLTVPKCGTTSTINWALLMEGEDTWQTIMEGARQAHGDSETAFLGGWVSPEIARAAESDESLRTLLEDGARNLDFSTQMAYRTVHRFGVGSFDIKVDSKTFLPPAHLCPMCCLHGYGRQRVVLARNPFVRIMSYFRYSWLDSSWTTEGQDIWTTWSGFGIWLRSLIDAWSSQPQGFASNLTWVEDPVTICTPLPVDDIDTKERFSTMDCRSSMPTSRMHSSEVFHIRPLIDMLRDPRFVAGETAIEDGLHVLHLETLSEDIMMLEHRLCNNFSYCNSLPPFPKVLPGKMPDNLPCKLNVRTLQWDQLCIAPAWRELWTKPLVELVLTAYSDDFRILGYSTDPLNLLPLRTRR